MPHRTISDVIIVWATTGVANLIAIFSDIFRYLPMIQNILAIISISLAIAYTLYKFAKDWRGFNPRKKK